MSTFAKDTTPLLEKHSKMSSQLPMTVITTESSSTSIGCDSAAAAAAPKERMVSLDQYRGFIVLCLITIGLLGHLNDAPNIFKHKNNFFSLADAIMPQFYLIIGFSMQLTHLKVRTKEGIRGMFLKQLRRSRTLYLIGLIYHSVDDQKNWRTLCDNWPRVFLQPILSRNLFQTLTIISITQLVILPVITRSPWIRICYSIASTAVYMLGQWGFWMEYQWRRAIDGGSFGAFSWVLIMIAGTLLHDWYQWICKIPCHKINARRRRVIKGIIGLVIISGICCALGYLISSIPASWSPMCYATNGSDPVVCPNISLPSIPFVSPDTNVVSLWTMSQRFASLSINLSAIGFALLVYLFWFILSEVYNVQFSLLKRLSTYSLLMYMLEEFPLKLATRIIPKDSPLYMMPVLLVIGLSGNILVLRFLEMNNINVRL